MVIHYSTRKLEKILNNPRLVKKFYGKDYQKIMNRLSELIAADNLSKIPECPPPRRHKLVGNLKNNWGIDYSKNNRIVIQPTGEFDINDLTSITEIEIINLEDYH